MKSKIVTLSLSVLLLTSCSKTIDKVVNSITNNNTAATTETATVPADGFVQYTIKQGEQYCDKNNYVQTKYSQLSFKVKFDSSAIYQTLSAGNQKDVNKLYGFSDNNAQHHEFSARFGWRWSDNALRLFGYVYNDSKVSMEEIGTIKIGEEANCAIKVNADTYVFTLNDQTLTMPRTSTTVEAEGYKLYPYFGGDELAPHEIHIWIKE